MKNSAFMRVPHVLAFALATIAWQQQRSASVFGTVIDQATGEPIAGVSVILTPSGGSSTTDSAGRFELRDIPFGDYAVSFERLGYPTRRDSLRFGPGRPLEIRVELSKAPVPLEPIEVTVRSGVLEREGYYERRAFRTGGSTFLSAEDIEQYKPIVLSDLMARIPAASVVSFGPGQRLVRFNRQENLGTTRVFIPGCEPAVFLDGILIQDQIGEPRLLDFNRVDPAVVAGMEVYVGSNTPLRFRRTSCGAILIWTKR